MEGKFGGDTVLCENNIFNVKHMATAILAFFCNAVPQTHAR